MKRWRPPSFFKAHFTLQLCCRWGNASAAILLPPLHLCRPYSPTLPQPTQLHHFIAIVLWLFFCRPASPKFPRLRSAAPLAALRSCSTGCSVSYSAGSSSSYSVSYCAIAILSGVSLQQLSWGTLSVCPLPSMPLSLILYPPVLAPLPSYVFMIPPPQFLCLWVHALQSILILPLYSSGGGCAEVEAWYWRSHIPGLTSTHPHLAHKGCNVVRAPWWSHGVCVITNLWRLCPCICSIENSIVCDKHICKT